LELAFSTSDAVSASTVAAIPAPAAANVFATDFGVRHKAEPAFDERDGDVE
jgi:hypothetical protein